MRVSDLVRPLRRRPDPSAMRRLTLAALAGLWVIIPSGALVRLTDSGLGCPDWPLCEGRVVPASAGHAAIEFSNRILSGLVMALAVVVWLMARRARVSSRALRWRTGVAAAATVVQVPLGAITVMSGLHPLAVSSHFLVSIVALGSGTLAWIAADDLAAGRLPRRWGGRRGPMAGAAGLALTAVIVSGVLVTASGPHSGDRDATQRFGDFTTAATVHVRAVVAFAVLALVLAAWLWREGGTDARTRRWSLAVLPLLGAQIALGEYQYRNGLPEEVVLVHVTVAAALWSVALTAVWEILRPPAGAPEPQAGTASRSRRARRISTVS